MVERREFRRHKVLGEMEIQSVLGMGTIPERRPTVLDCSLGGARLRVHSPARRLFRAVAPCLHVRDSMTCVLRVEKAELEVFAEVVRVRRLEDEPDSLDVGVRFFQDADRRSYNERPMARLARLLEPDRSEEEAAALAAAVAARPARPLAVTPPQPAPATTAAKPVAPKAGELEPLPVKAAAAALERELSARHKTVAAPAKTSARVAKTSARVAKPSGRVATAAPTSTPAPATSSPSSVQSSDSDVVAWAAARLAAPKGASAHVATALDEVSERGSARLVNGAATIALSQTFTASVRESGLTVHVTPTDECLGLFVAERTPARIVVRELAAGRSGATFDYLVIGSRRSLG